MSAPVKHEPEIITLFADMVEASPAGGMVVLPVRDARALLVTINASERAEALAKLRELLPPGATVDCVLRHVSRSGMQRIISFYARSPEGPVYLDGYVAKVLDMTRPKGRDGLKVNGCGMDMGFHVVYNLGYALYGRDGWTCTGDRCPSNDHSNGDRDYSPHTHKDGGYALRHNWL